MLKTLNEGRMSHCTADGLTEADEIVSQLDHASKKESASILIVDDESVNLRVAEAFLEDDGYRNVVLCDRPELALPLVSQHRPDVILLDVMMPSISGLDLLRMLRTNLMTRHVPVIVLTSVTDRQTKSRALQLGATDFLPKPLDAFELLPRVRNALVLRAHQLNLEHQTASLEQLVRRRTAELVWTQLQVIHCLARACEYRDNETGRHAVRVGRNARIIAEQIGEDPGWCEELMLAAMLHDVGKIGVRDAILLKPGRLDPEEFCQMKDHCRFGEEIISPAWRDELLPLLDTDFLKEVNGSSLLELASRIAATHHERWDGAGYPRGLRGEEIPLEGRITAVADVFDAVGSERPYKPAFPLDKCRDIVREGAGGHFDPRVVQAFLARFDEIVAVREQLRD
jgi:putative two-component system response regulator